MLLTTRSVPPSIMLGTTGSGGGGGAWNGKGGDDNIDATALAVAAAAPAAADLRPGVHDGGAKLREGTPDLLSALAADEHSVRVGGPVLELGAARGQGGGHRRPVGRQCGGAPRLSRAGAGRLHRRRGRPQLTGGGGRERRRGGGPA